MVTRAVSTWSLHRTLGRFVAGDSTPHGGPFMKSGTDTVGLSLIELPAELRRRGYDALQICHFHIPSRSPEYLAELRTSLAASNIELDAILVDDGDMTNLDDADLVEAWIGGWLETSVELGAKRARVSAGKSAPNPERIAESSKRLARLAAAHPQVRVVAENWMGMMPDSKTVLAVLEASGKQVGLLIDLGNWTGSDKYDELTAIAPLAESCHAKCHFTGSEPDREDFRRTLQILKDTGYDGPLAFIYDGTDDNEWACLDAEYAIAREVFA